MNKRKREVLKELGLVLQELLRGVRATIDVDGNWGWLKESRLTLDQKYAQAKGVVGTCARESIKKFDRDVHQICLSSRVPDLYEKLLESINPAIK